MLKGFKDFIMRGNVIDLAVAVVMGTAFTAWMYAGSVPLPVYTLNCPPMLSVPLPPRL